MKRSVFRWTLLAAAGSAALALAACHSSTAENVETNISNLDVTVNETNMTVEPTNVITPLPAANVTAPAPTAPGNDFDTTRTEDDAAATGMTARTDRDETNTGTPAQ